MHSARAGRGQILPLFALSITVLLLFVALVIDGGFAFERRREAQNAADLAALAGTRVVSLGLDDPSMVNRDVYAALSTTASANGATVPGLGTSDGPVYVDGNGAVLAGTGGVVSDASTAIPAAARGVKVAASRTWTPYLLGLISSGDWTATATATARTTRKSQPVCVFCVIDTSPPGPVMSMQSGQTSLQVQGGAFGSNAGLSMQANPTLQATGTGAGISVYGTVSLCNNCAPSPAVTRITAPIPDPLAFLPDPVLPAGTQNGPVDAKGPGTTVTLNPGIYRGWTVEANATLRLNPGTYYLTGNVSVQSNGSLVGAGVTLVFMGPQTSFLPQSNSTVSITAPPPTSTTATFPGMAFYFARNNKGTLQMQSSSLTSITGTIYAINTAALLDMQSGTTMATVHSMIVVGSANLQSSSKLTVVYDGSQNVQLPGVPPSLVQ